MFELNWMGVNFVIAKGELQYFIDPPPPTCSPLFELLPSYHIW